MEAQHTDRERISSLRSSDRNPRRIAGVFCPRNSSGDAAVAKRDARQVRPGAALLRCFTPTLGEWPFKEKKKDKGKREREERRQRYRFFGLYIHLVLDGPCRRRGSDGTRRFESVLSVTQRRPRSTIFLILRPACTIIYIRIASFDARHDHGESANRFRDIFRIFSAGVYTVARDLRNEVRDRDDALRNGTLDIILYRRISRKEPYEMIIFGGVFKNLTYPVNCVLGSK